MSARLASAGVLTLTVRLSDYQAQQLAQLIKRIDFQTVREFTEGYLEPDARDARTYLMLEGLGAIRNALAEHGVAPR